MASAHAHHLPDFSDPLPAPAGPSLLGAAGYTVDALQSALQDAFADPWAAAPRLPRAPAARTEPAPGAAPEGTAAPVTDPPPGVATLFARVAAFAAASQPAPEPELAPILAPVMAPLTAPVSPKRGPTEEERAALIAQAEARGRAQGRAEAQAEADAAMERERAAFAERLAEARQGWVESEAEVLAAGFAAALRALDGGLTDRIARLLGPVLTDALRRQALDELSAALGRLLADPQHAALRVSGPADLLAGLAERLGPLGASITFAPAETADVRVTADQTVIETQLAAWTRLIASAAHGEDA